MKTKNLSVLLIEDSPSWMEIYKGTLEEIGITNPDCAVNEIEALKYIQKNNYNVIIADTMDENGKPMGPNSVKEARELGQSPLVIASSNNPKYINKYWKDIPHDYFLNKRDYNESKLIEVIKKATDEH